MQGDPKRNEMMLFYKRNIILLFSILTFGLLDNSDLSAQDAMNLNPKELIGHWVLYYNLPHVYPPKQDTLEYVPFNSPLTEDLHPALKYGGIQFKDNGFFLQHVFIKCGTGNPPDSFDGSWKIIKENDKLILSIKINERPREYYIHFLSSDKLILINKY